MTTLIDFLKAKGLILAENECAVLSTGKGSTQVIPLIHQRVLSVKGSDTEKFLQGQLTCDVTTTFSRGSSLGAHCNIKGHMLSLFRLLKRNQEEAWLRMSHDIFDSALTNLKKYIIFSKAEAEDISEQFAGVGVTGPGAQALIENLFGQSPSEDNGILPLSEGIVVRVPGDRFEIWMEQSALTALLDKLPDEVSIGATNTWLLSEIDAGIPDLRAETQEDFIPQMINLQALEGVSFSKGCYTGQEIVTRLQHRGVLKKPMFIAEVTADSQPVPGQIISSPSSSTAGEILLSASCDQNDNNRYRLLAVINKKAADEETLQISGTDAELTLLDLPYKLDPELFSRKERLVQ